MDWYHFSEIVGYVEERWGKGAAWIALLVILLLLGLGFWLFLRLVT